MSILVLMSGAYLICAIDEAIQPIRNYMNRPKVYRKQNKNRRFV